jgi:hypothetical protein
MAGAVKQAASIHPIELKISDLHQLFNSMDPSPFHERDLDHDAEEFIVSWARESPKDAVIRLVVHLARPLPDLADPQPLVSGSLRHYFAYRAEITLRELKQLLQQGRASLGIGLVFLVACNALATLFAPGPGTWHGIAREGLAILGWVAMWHPLEILLYRWWPVLRLKRLYERLARAEIVVKFGG